MGMESTAHMHTMQAFIGHKKRSYLPIMFQCQPAHVIPEASTQGHSTIHARLVNEAVYDAIEEGSFQCDGGVHLACEEESSCSDGCSDGCGDDGVHLACEVKSSDGGVHLACEEESSCSDGCSDGCGDDGVHLACEVELSCAVCTSPVRSNQVRWSTPCLQGPYKSCTVCAAQGRKACSAQRPR
eukprot:1141960-Pelagomonas_calceolata.AAC.1